MNEAQFNSLALGIILVLAGLAVIIFHRAIKKWQDWWNSLPFPLGAGEMWSGKYTRGGLVFTYAAIIVSGLALLTFGIVSIVNAFRN